VTKYLRSTVYKEKVFIITWPYCLETVVAQHIIMGTCITGGLIISPFVFLLNKTVYAVAIYSVVYREWAGDLEPGTSSE
jgi:hypothetical protein